MISASSTLTGFKAFRLALEVIIDSGLAKRDVLARLIVLEVFAINLVG
jgi:hypothetical protein